jgi:hypothetical protein
VVRSGPGVGGGAVTAGAGRRAGGSGRAPAVSGRAPPASGRVRGCRPRARNVARLWAGATGWVISTRRRELGRKPVVRGAGEGDFYRAEKRDGPRPSHDPAARGPGGSPPRASAGHPPRSPPGSATDPHPTARSGRPLCDHRLDRGGRTAPRPGWIAADTHGCAPAADGNPTAPSCTATRLRWGLTRPGGQLYRPGVTAPWNRQSHRNSCAAASIDQKGCIRRAPAHRVRCFHPSVLRPADLFNR